METTPLAIADIRYGPRASRLRLLSPLRYLAIRHPEKTRYDIALPLVVGLIAWLAYVLLDPRPAIFGDAGLLKIARDILMMVVPFLIGGLAGVAMGAPGPHFDLRPRGAPLYLDGKVLTLRQFMCYLLGYLSFLSFISLLGTVVAQVLHPPIASLLANHPLIASIIMLIGAFALSVGASALIVTVLWALYFLTDIVNREAPR